MAYDPYLRPNYELGIAASWLGAAGTLGVAWDFLQRPPSLLAIAAGLCVPAILWGARAARRVRRLDRDEVAKIRARDLLKRMRRWPRHAWLGWGFDWTPAHAQRALDYRLSGRKEDLSDAPGKPWIHGMNGGLEEEIRVPLKTLEGHTLLLGTTGSGKTRAFEVLVTQAIHRGDTAILLDPKGDKDLRERMERESRRAGRARDFLFFHPAFPSQSFRINPLQNFNRTTEIASRVASLMPSEGEAGPFKAFAFRSLNLVAQCLVDTGRRPTIRDLRNYIEGGAETLLIRAILAFADRERPGWRAEAAEWFDRAHAGKLRPLEGIPDPEDLAVYHWYRETLARTPAGAEGIDGLLSMVEHNRLHFSKMIASLLPILNMLTSGHLGELLSPDEERVDDPRLILDSSRILSGKYVVYIGLDALSDAMVASAIGAMLLADFASVAGQIYNRDVRAGPVWLFIDEAAEVVNDPFIQILNKGRGAGFQVVMATQTLPDLIARTGDESRARQIVGNCNNLISLRIKDGDTQKFVTETFGKTYVQTLQQNMGTSMQTQNNMAHYTGMNGQSLSYGECELFPQHLLGHLPNFHYIASLAGGRIVKGRLPVFAD
jgi:conjugal transfer pilus assembly protein TraD